MKPGNKASLWPIFITVFVDLLGLGMVIPIAAPLLFSKSAGLLPLNFGLSERSITLGLLLGCYSIAQFFGAPVLGALADKYGRKKLLLVSQAGTFLGYILFAVGILQRDIFLCFTSRILDGFTGGNISIAMSAIADITDEKNRARNFGLIGMSFGLGFILGPFIGGKLADPNLVKWFNFSTPYWFAAILSLLNIIGLSWKFKETLRTVNSREINFLSGFNNIKIALGDKKLRAILGVVFLTVFGFNFFTQFFQVFLIHKFNYNQSDIADIFAYIGIWLAFTQGGITRPLSKKFLPEQLVSVPLLLLALAMPILLVPLHSNKLYFILPFIAMLNGVSTPNLTALISIQAGANQQGSILGIRQSVQSLAMAIPPIIAGFITTINFNLPIYAAGFCTFLGWIVFVLFYKKRGKEIQKN